MLDIGQIIIFLDLTLLAIMVALFVFASSIYKGAIKIASKEEEESLERRKQLIKVRKTELSASLKESSEDNFLKELRENLEKLDSELMQLDKSILKSRNKAKALSLKSMVSVPAIQIILSMVGAGIAVSLSGNWQTSIWVVSVAFLVAGSYFLYRNLRALEGLSSIIDLSVLMEQALDAHATKMSPILKIEFWTENIELERRLEVPRGEIRKIESVLSLEQGNAGKKSKATFTATQELEFVDEKVEDIKQDYMGMTKPKRFVKEVGDIGPKMYYPVIFKIKTPDKRGTYVMSYFLECEGFTLDEVFLEIIVK